MLLFEMKFQEAPR